MSRQPAPRPRSRAASGQDRDRVALWAMATDQAADLMALTDLDGRVLAVNRALLSVLGRTESEVVGQQLSNAFAAGNPPNLIREMAENALRDGGWRGECLVAGADGTALSVLLSVGPVRDADGHLVGTFGVGSDITDRKRTEESLRASEELFRQLTENMSEVIFTVEVDPPRMSYTTRAYERIWGRSREDLYRDPRAWIEAVHPDDRPRMSEAFGQGMKGLSTDSEFRIVRPDGAVRWIRSRTFPVTDLDGRLLRLVGIAEDVTTRHLDEVARREAHEKLDRTLRDIEQRTQEAEKLTEVVDILQSCQSVEEAYGILGSALPTIVAAHSGALCLTSPSRDVVEAVVTWGPSSPTQAAFDLDACWAIRRGRMHLVEDATSPLRCAHIVTPSQHGYVCVPLTAQSESLGVLCLEGAPPASPAPDVTEPALSVLGRQASAVGERLSLALVNLRLRELLRWQSIRDPLTGLFNRRYMEESLDRELKRAARDAQSVSVLMLDLDHFKRFNDTFGHHAGDTLLRGFGDLLLKRTRGEDVACRFGGEEFVIILSGSAVEDATARAESLRESARHLVVPYAGQVLGKVTLSVGVASFPTHGDTAQGLLHAADQALYSAKAEGRDRVVVAS